MKGKVVVSGFCLTPGRDVFEGEVLSVPEDLTEREFKLKVQQGMILDITASAAAAKLPGSSSGKIRAGDPTAQHGDPKS